MPSPSSPARAAAGSGGSPALAAALPSSPTARTALGIGSRRARTAAGRTNRSAALSRTPPIAARQARQAAVSPVRVPTPTSPKRGFRETRMREHALKAPKVNRINGNTCPPAAGGATARMESLLERDERLAATTGGGNTGMWASISASVAARQMGDTGVDSHAGGVEGEGVLSVTQAERAEISVEKQRQLLGMWRTPEVELSYIGFSARQHLRWAQSLAT